MRRGKFDHVAQLSTERIAGGQVGGLYREPALVVNMYFGHRFARGIGCRCIGLAFWLAHACGPWSVKLTLHSYLNRIGGASACRGGVYTFVWLLAFTIGAHGEHIEALGRGGEEAA